MRSRSPGCPHHSSQPAQQPQHSPGLSQGHHHQGALPSPSPRSRPPGLRVCSRREHCRKGTPPFTARKLDQPQPKPASACWILIPMLRPSAEQAKSSGQSKAKCWINFGQSGRRVRLHILQASRFATRRQKAMGVSTHHSPQGWSARHGQLRAECLMAMALHHTYESDQLQRRVAAQVGSSSSLRITRDRLFCC